MASSLESKYRPKNLPIYFQYRKFKWDQFCVGVFGALAVFGVLLKIWKEPFWGYMDIDLAQNMYKIFMPVGFLGEMIVFIIMGFMKGDQFIEVYPDEQDSVDEHDEVDGIVVNMQLPDSLKELIEEKVSAQLDGKLSELTNLLVDDVEKTRDLLADTNEINSKIQNVASSLGDLSVRILSVGESLGEFEKVNAGGLSENASSVSERLASANTELITFEEEMRKLANRFKNFNSVNN